MFVEAYMGETDTKKGNFHRMKRQNEQRKLCKLSWKRFRILRFDVTLLNLCNTVWTVPKLFKARGGRG